MTKIGNYQLHTVEAGRFRLDGGAMFGIIPKMLWSRHTEADEKNRIPLAMRCLLLEGDGRLILIDNGLGHKYDDKFANIFAVDHDHSTMESSLSALGFSPNDVTDVVLTHLHFDHCGGRRLNGLKQAVLLILSNSNKIRIEQKRKLLMFHQSNNN